MYSHYWILKVIDLKFCWKVAFKRGRRFYFRIAVLENYWIVTKNYEKPIMITPICSKFIVH